MNIVEYFDDVQEYVKEYIENPEKIDNIIKELQRDNLQAVVNQYFNKGLSVEECGKKILKLLNIKIDDNLEEPNRITGDRNLNKMEKKIMKYSEFINDGRKFI